MYLLNSIRKDILPKPIVMSKFTRNQDYFALKRRLTSEARLKLELLPKETEKYDYGPNRVSNDGLTFVYEWAHNGAEILGYGCNSRGHACCLQTTTSPGLFVVTNNFPVLEAVCSVYAMEFEYNENFKFEKHERLTFDSNNFAVWDLFSNPELAGVPCFLVKIKTKSIGDAQRLYNKFRYNIRSYRFVGVQQYFDVTKNIVFELLVKRHSSAAAGSAIDYTVPDTVMTWFDKDLNAYRKFPAPEIPVISFDIETVSDDPHRVPTGDHPKDFLYTVSIYHSHTKLLYTLVFLPLAIEPTEILRLILEDEYDIVPDKSIGGLDVADNLLECFNNEKLMLERTMQLLTLKPFLHILYGYNSINYDIKYLVTRCVFYGICSNDFVWREGYTFGMEQMHLDLFRIALMRYRLKAYSLNNVAWVIMKEAKTGVNAVNLRNSFFRMLKNQKYYKHTRDETSEKFPSVRDTLEYNNWDTMLVHRLEKKTKSIEFLVKKAQCCQVPLSTMNTNYDKMQFKMWNECFVVGLGMGLFLALFKDSTAVMRLPCPSYYDGGNVLSARVDLAHKLNVINSSVDKDGNRQRMAELYNTAVTTFGAKKKKSKFPGGANFCLGEYDVENVQMYDYVTAYPLLMVRKNISDETTAVIPANMLRLAYPMIQGKERFRTYDYMAHSGASKSETVIIYYQYIYDGLYCGGAFDFTDEELKKRHDAPVIVIWEFGRRGILSKIVERFNHNRARTKVMRNTLDESYNVVSERIDQINNQRRIMEEMQEAMAEAAAEAEAVAAANSGGSRESAECDDDGAFGAAGEGDDDDGGGAFGMANEDDDNDGGAFGMASEDSCGAFGTTGQYDCFFSKSRIAEKIVFFAV